MTPHTLTFSPPCLTALWTFLSRNSSPTLLLHQRRPSEHTRLNLDSSDHHTLSQSDSSHLACCLAQIIRRNLCDFRSIGLRRRTRPGSPSLRSSRQTVVSSASGKYLRCSWVASATRPEVIARATMRDLWASKYRGRPDRGFRRFGSRVSRS